MKKFFTKTLSIAIASILLISSMIFITSCDKPTNDETQNSKLTGSVSEILNEILSNTDAELSMSMEEQLTSENSEYTTGLTAEDFENYISEGVLSSAMISTHAHLVALLKVKNIEDAAAVKQMVAEKFNSFRWVCVMPDKSIVIESGEYIFLVASKEPAASALIESFKKSAEVFGTADIFFDLNNISEEDFYG